MIESPTPFAVEHGLPRMQFAWDSTSLGVLKECPRRYEYEIIHGWRTPGFANVHLFFGQLYHAGMEAYDHYCAAELGHLSAAALSDDEHQAAVRTALRHVLNRAGVREKDGSWTPWRSTDPYKNIWTLCRSIVWYLDAFRKNTAVETLMLSTGKPAVELSFRFPIEPLNGVPLLLCGHLDRGVQNTSDKIKSIHDRKTTKGQLNAQYWSSFSPHNQFSLYTVAGNIYFDNFVSGITVDAAQVLVNSSSFARMFIPFPKAVIDEWMEDTRFWIGQAMKFAEQNYWPKNDKSCDKFGGCPFRKVCSKSPHHRQQWLEADFTVFKWNPLETRGDI